ncbi:hypothetical protein AHAS_Ahas11G0259200 [Arachis hypogaea]
MVIINGVASRTRSKKKERSLHPSPWIGSGTSRNDPIIVGSSDSSSDEGSEGGGRSLDWDFGFSSDTEDTDNSDEEKKKRRCKRKKKEKKRREQTFESHSNKVLGCDEVIMETECARIYKKSGENKNNSSSIENNVFDHQQEKMLPKDADCASVLFGERNMEGYSSKKNEDKEKNVAKRPVEGFSSKKNEDKGKKVEKKPMPAGKRARKRVKRTGENVGNPNNVHKQDTISKEPARNVQQIFFVKLNLRRRGICCGKKWKLCRTR